MQCGCASLNRVPGNSTSSARMQQRCHATALVTRRGCNGDVMRQIGCGGVQMEKAMVGRRHALGRLTERSGRSLVGDKGRVAAVQHAAPWESKPAARYVDFYD